MGRISQCVLAVRYLLVMLFFPFSALDKILNFGGAVAQARQVAPAGPRALLILAGLGSRSSCRSVS